MNNYKRAIIALSLAATLAVIPAIAEPTTLEASALAPAVAQAGHWVGEWNATVRVNAKGELAGEPIHSESETVVHGELAADLLGGNDPQQGVAFESPKATWRFSEHVSYMPSETTGSGSIEGGELVLADERLAPGAQIVWREERRVGSFRTIVRAPHGDQFIDGPIDTELEPIVFTVTEVTPTTISGTIDLAPLAASVGMKGERSVDSSGSFELRLQNQGSHDSVSRTE